MAQQYLSQCPHCRQHTSEKNNIDLSKIKHTIAYPRVSTAIYNNPSAGGGLYTGNRVDLKYWDGSQYVDEFPAGVSIAWFLVQGGYEKQGVSVRNKSVFYSIRDLNPNREHRTIALKNTKGRIVTLGLEDANLQDSKTGNFGDALFYLDFSEDINSSGVPDLPEVPIDTAKVETTYSGMLSFEDLWPSEGDYDMNDMLVEYSRKIHKSFLTGKVIKIVDTFVPMHKGGSLQSGFGYQLTGIPLGDVRSITVEADGVVSKFMEGQLMEPGQDYPTVILFDDFSQVQGKKLTVSIELAPEKYADLQLTPFSNHPYWKNYWFTFNPFIITRSNEGRGCEVHIVKFPPTQKADFSNTGTKSDSIVAAQGLYYVNKLNLPTGLHLSGVKVGDVKGENFIIPIETQSILLMYPDFEAWAKSFGTEKANWWKNPAR